MGIVCSPALLDLSDNEREGFLFDPADALLCDGLSIIRLSATCSADCRTFLSPPSFAIDFMHIEY